MTAMLKVSVCAALVVLCAEREHLGHVDPREQVGREVGADQRRIEAVDARGHRGVRRENGPGAHDLEGLVETEATADEVVDALETQEAGVALVGVEHLGSGGAREFCVELDRADTPDAQQQLLQSRCSPPPP